MKHGLKNGLIKIHLSIKKPPVYYYSTGGFGKGYKRSSFTTEPLMSELLIS